MNTYLNPPRSLWAEICCRPAFDLSALYATVQLIMEAVRTRGDEALLELEARFDHCQLTSLAVSEEAMRSAEAEIDATLAQSIQLAADNIRCFHAAQCFHTCADYCGRDGLAAQRAHRARRTLRPWRYGPFA